LEQPTVNPLYFPEPPKQVAQRGTQGSLASAEFQLFNESKQDQITIADQAKNLSKNLLGLSSQTLESTGAQLDQKPAYTR
jgi:hypothetical protein